MYPLFPTNRLFWLHPTGHNIPTVTVAEEEVNAKLNLGFCPHVYPDWDMVPVEILGKVTIGPIKYDLDIKKPLIYKPKLGYRHGAGAPEDNLDVTIKLPTVSLNSDNPINLPCLHPLPIKRFVDGLWINFFTDNSFIQQKTIEAVSKLLFYGVRLSTPLRPINIFYRGYLDGYPSDSTNPFWSHYDFTTNSIQITDFGVPETDARKNEILDTLHHELGHATLGHRLIQITTPGGTHNLKTEKDPALAMSEGWAHFIALVLRHEPDSTPSTNIYAGQSWEQRSGCKRSPNIEYNVACALWDIYDERTKISLVNLSIPDEGLKISFSELYRIFSPTLSTLDNGPFIQNIDQFFERLSENNPLEKEAISNVRAINCGYAKKIALKAFNNNYVHVVGQELYAPSNVIAMNGKFILEKEDRTAFNHGDSVHMKSFIGKYLVAENNGGAQLLINRTLPAEWETFVIELVSGSGTITPGCKIALKYKGTQKYVSFNMVTTGIGNPTVPTSLLDIPTSLNINGSSIGEKETFVIEFV